MKKIVFIIFVFFTITTNAQLFSGGINTGFSATQIDGDLRGGYHKFGVSAFIFAQLNLNSNFSIISGVGFNQKGARLDNQFVFYRTRLNYAEIPLLININPFKKLFHKTLNKFDLTFGITYGYLINGTQTLDFSDFNETDMNLRKYDLSYYSSINYRFSKKISLHFIHNYSLIPITKDNFWESLNTNWFFFFLADPPVSRCWWNNVARITIQFTFFSKNKKE